MLFLLAYMTSRVVRRPCRFRIRSTVRAANTHTHRIDDSYVSTAPLNCKAKLAKRGACCRDPIASEKTHGTRIPSRSVSIEAKAELSDQRSRRRQVPIPEYPSLIAVIERKETSGHECLIIQFNQFICTVTALSSKSNAQHIDVFL